MFQVKISKISKEVKILSETTLDLIPERDKLDVIPLDVNPIMTLRHYSLDIVPFPPKLDSINMVLTILYTRLVLLCATYLCVFLHSVPILTESTTQLLFDFS